MGTFASSQIKQNVYKDHRGLRCQSQEVLFISSLSYFKFYSKVAVFVHSSPLYLYSCIKPENVVAETDGRLARGELLGELPAEIRNMHGTINTASKEGNYF